MARPLHVARRGDRQERPHRLHEGRARARAHPLHGVHGRRRQDLAERRPERAARHLHEAREEVRGHGDLERVVRDVLASAVPVAAEALVEVLGLVELRHERREVDRAERDERARRVDAVGLRADLQGAAE